MMYALTFFLGYLFCWFVFHEPAKQDPPPRPVRRLIAAHIYNEEGTVIEHRYTCDGEPEDHTVLCFGRVLDMQRKWPHRRIEFIWE